VANDYAASLVADHPARFGLLAALPLHDPGETVREVGRAVNELGADGLLLPTTRARRHQIGLFDMTRGEARRDMTFSLA